MRWEHGGQNHLVFLFSIFPEKFLNDGTSLQGYAVIGFQGDRK